MKRWLILLSFSCAYSTMLLAQQFVPAVLASNGGTGKTSELQLDWTLGENSIDGADVQNRRYTEGFHQPILLIEKIEEDEALTSSNQWTESGNHISVFPNPTYSELTIRFIETDHPLLVGQVIDANGQLQLYKYLWPNSGDVEFDLSSLAPGFFYLRFIAPDTGVISTFKLIKIK